MTFFRDRLPEPQSYFEAQGLTLQRGGKWRTTECRFHGGSDSLRVNIKTGAFVCMAACGVKGGDVVAYQMLAHGQEFVAAARALGAWALSDRPAALRQAPLPFSARDGLEVVRAECLLIAVAACNIAKGLELASADRARLLQAAGRIEFIASEIGK